MVIKFETKSKSDYLRELRALAEQGREYLFAYGDDWNCEFYIFYESLK